MVVESGDKERPHNVSRCKTGTGRRHYEYWEEEGVTRGIWETNLSRTSQYGDEPGVHDLGRHPPISSLLAAGTLLLRRGPRQVNWP